jgi:hypothetical protein
MKRLYFILMMAIAVMTQCLIKTDAQAQTHTKQRIPNSLYYWEYLPPGYTEEPTRKFPLLIFFHGNGERADLNDDPLLELDSMLVAGPPKEIKNGQTMCFEINNVTECFIVISPQLTKAYTSWGVAFPDKVLSHALTTYAGRIDESRIYLTGLSLGAIATLQYVQTTNKPLVDKVAAIAPMAGGKTGSNVCILRDRDIAVWAVHGENDENTGTPLSHMQTFINNLNACSPQPNPLAVLTIVDNAGHNVWDRAYRTDSTYYKPNVYEWLLKNATGSAGQRAPTAPYVNAGPDKSLAAGTTNVVLNGHVARNDGATATYLWTQEAGTATNLSGINSKNLTVNGLATGTYVFRLASTDSWGVTSTDDVTVTVAGSGGGSHSYIQLKAINGTASNAAGTRIELYSDAQQATGAKDPTPYQNGNTHLQFFVKSIQGTAPNLNSLQVGLKANSQNLYVVAGDYDLETTADGWTRVAIPISAWGFSASNWAVGVLNVGFKGTSFRKW